MEAGHAHGDRFGVVGHRQVDALQVKLVVTGQYRHHQRNIFHAPCDRPAMIERPRQRHYAANAHAAVSRLESNHAAHGRGGAHGTAGIGTERAKSIVIGYRGG